MTIPRALARSLIKKFSAKQGFPKEDEAIASLIDAFQKYAVSEAHARTIAEELDIETPYCPDVSNIRRVSLATRPTMRRKSDGCPLCGGTGFEEFTVERKSIAGCEHAMTAQAVRLCQCRVATEAMAAVSAEVGGGI